MEMDAEIIDYPTNGGRRGPSLPHAVDAERALLGAFMVNNEVLDNVSAFLKEEFFYDKRHKLTFSTMLRLFENGAFDPVLLAERLGAENKSVGCRRCGIHRRAGRHWRCAGQHPRLRRVGA